MASAECEASATCNAQAKADANLEVECTPPTLQIDLAYAVDASVQARAELDFTVQTLKVRLPRLLAALARARLVLDGGEALATAAGGAVEGALDAFLGEVDAVTGYKLVTCAVPAFGDSARILDTATTELSTRVEAAGQLTVSLIDG
jgi:hypothetical protein